MTNERLKVAIAGAGMVTRHHLIGWSRISGAKVVAIQNRTIEKARQRAAEFGIPNVYSELEEMLVNEKPDALDIAVAQEAHAEYARIAADLGVDILCQKPMTPSLAESEKLISDIGNKVRFMVHENWRFRPQYRQAAAWIVAGKTGPIREFRLTARNSGLVSRNEDGIPLALERQPFLARLKRFIIHELLVHHLDTIRFLVGPMQVLACHTMRISAEVTGEDAALILLKAENGAVGTVSGNMSSPGFPALSQDRLELIGEKASIILEEETLHLIGESEDTVHFDLAEAYQQSYDNTIAHFVNAIASGEPFETDRLDNLETLRLVDEAYRRTGL